MVDQTAAPAPEHSQVVVFPPVIPLSGFLLGVVLEMIWPTGPMVSNSLRMDLRVIGGGLFCLGAAGFLWMVVTMKKVGTPIHNSATPTALVETGPFRFTRNPMYLFGATAYAGLALLLMQAWSLALLPAVVAATNYGVVLREEAFLERRFGGAYKEYQSRVRRWL
jgi:protein-S-isoprenylcysteine O-methyltransferase Ste14